VTALRWGLLGTARINRLLIPAIRASARSVVAAVASRSTGRAQAYAREWGIPRALASYEALLASDVDIVYVPLPNSLHAQWTVAALTAGKHVLCEKPLALGVGDVRAIATAAAAHRRVVAEGFMYRHHARTRRIEELLASGAIGELQLVAGTFSYLRSRDGDVRLDPALGGGALWDVGCYPVSFAQMCAGAEPRLAIGWQHTGPTGVDEQFAGTIVYGNGVHAQVSASFTAAYSTAMRLTGTAGTLDIPQPFKPAAVDRIWIRRNGSDEAEEVIVAGAPPFVDEVADMEDAVLGVRAPRVTLADSARHAAALTALYASARSRRQVEIVTPVAS
jgi:predicted dehydrogenase